MVHMATLNNMKVCFKEEVLMDKCISTEKVSKCLLLRQIYFFLVLFQNFDEEMLMEYFLCMLMVVDVCLSSFILFIEVYI